MKHSLTFCLLMLLLFTGFQTFAQKEANHWFFGKNAGLRFDGPHYTLLANGKINTPEGCSTISDSLGNLLFYTDGLKVWNKNHQQMPNGSGLKGDPSSSQSALIVKKPGSNLIYYIFTTAARAEAAGLQYSVVDMSLQGGMGDVTTKNTLLLTPVAEKITAVNHRQDQDVWVVAHKWGDNSFYSYPVTAGGIGQPVISQTGMVHSGNIDNALGCLKASPDGTKIASAIQFSHTFELFDFDDRTGQISNPVTFTSSKYMWAYGVEFSPDGTRLYAGSMGITGAINQVTLTDPHPDSVRKSLTFVGGVDNALYGSMQLSPGGYIYIAVADSNILSVIQAPNNNPSDSRFFKAGVILSGSKSTYGLPGFNQTYFLVPSFKYQEVCFGDTTFFELRVPYKFQSITYNFADPASGAANTSTLFNPWHYFTRPGNFDVVATGPINNGSIRTSTTRVKVHPLPPVNLGADTSMCPGDTLYLKSKGAYKKYKWNTGSEDAVLQITGPGMYWLEVTSEFGCVDRDSIVVSERQIPQGLTVKKADICYGEAATFQVGNNLATVTWPDNSTGPEYTTSLIGRHAVNVKINNCAYTDTIEVAYKNCPELHFFPNIITPDNDGLNDFFIIKGMPPGLAELTIFNRYGSRVFHTTSYQQDWNARDVSAGIYYYYLKLPDTGQTIKGWLEVVK